MRHFFTLMISKLYLFGINSVRIFVLQNLESSKYNLIFIKIKILRAFVQNFMKVWWVLKQFQPREVTAPQFLDWANFVTSLHFLWQKTNFYIKKPKYFAGFCFRRLQSREISRQFDWKLCLKFWLFSPPEGSAAQCALVTL